METRELGKSGASMHTEHACRCTLLHNFDHCSTPLQSRRVKTLSNSAQDGIEVLQLPCFCTGVCR